MLNSYEYLFRQSLLDLVSGKKKTNQQVSDVIIDHVETSNRNLSYIEYALNCSASLNLPYNNDQASKLFCRMVKFLLTKLIQVIKQALNQHAFMNQL